MPWAKRRQQHPGRQPGSRRPGDDVPQPAVTAGAALHQQAEIPRTGPVGRVVLARFQSRSREVPVHLDEVVRFTAHHAVGGPFPVSHDTLDMPQPPAGLLPDLPGQRLSRGFAGLNMAAHDLPAARQQPTTRGPPVHVHTVAVVFDQRADDLECAGHPSGSGWPLVAAVMPITIDGWSSFVWC